MKKEIVKISLELKSNLLLKTLEDAYLKKLNEYVQYSKEYAIEKEFYREDEDDRTLKHLERMKEMKMNEFNELFEMRESILKQL